MARDFPIHLNIIGNEAYKTDRCQRACQTFSNDLTWQPEGVGLIFTYSFRDFDPWLLGFRVEGRASSRHKHVEEDPSGHEAGKDWRLPRLSKAPHTDPHPSGKALPPKGPITWQTVPPDGGIIQTVTVGLWNLLTVGQQHPMIIL